MNRSLSRRQFFVRSAAVASAAIVAPSVFAADAKAPAFKISLAQWSLHKAFGRGGKATLDPLDFAKIAKQQFGIDAIEYVNQFYKDKKADDATVAELKKRAEGEGVRSVLIMCDGEGALGDADEKKRTLAVDNHKRWVEWAKALGCHSIRVNAQSSGSYDEQIKLAADGLGKLSQFAASHGINVIVENHGGLSSNGAWLAKVMTTVNLPTCGTLPDFGNFNVRRPDPKKAGDKGEVYDYLRGVDELMPFAKGVSAKSYDFNAEGNETKLDYKKLMDLVVNKHKYHGYVGIEYEGGRLSEPEGIQATKKLLEKIRGELG